MRESHCALTAFMFWQPSLVASGLGSKAKAYWVISIGCLNYPYELCTKQSSAGQLVSKHKSHSLGQ